MTWTHVQTAPGGATSCTFGGSVAVGDLVVAGVGGGSPGTVTVSDNSSGGPNTWTKINSGNSTLFYSVITTGGSFTITSSGGSFNAISAEEYSFTAGTISVPNTQNGTGSASSAPTTSAGVTFTAPTALIIGVIYYPQAEATITPNTGFTLRGFKNYTAGVNYGVATIEYIGSSSPQTPGATWGTAGVYAVIGASFQSSGDTAATIYLGNTAALLLQQA